jgi:hypothetical protein
MRRKGERRSRPEVSDDLPDRRRAATAFLEARFSDARVISARFGSKKGRSQAPSARLPSGPSAGQPADVKSKRPSLQKSQGESVGHLARIAVSAELGRQALLDRGRGTDRPHDEVGDYYPTKPRQSHARESFE